MSRQFSNQEIKEVVGAARVYCTCLSEAEFQNLVEMGKHLADSGYLEAVRGLARLEQDGIPCAEALDEYKVLLRRFSESEKKVAEVQSKLKTLEEEKRQVEESRKQATDSLEQARKELEQVRATRVKEEQGLEGSRAAAAREKERLDREVARCQQKANVSKEDIAAAGKLKTEVEAIGFTVETMLDLARELAGCENARDELAASLEQYRTLGGAVAALDQQYQEKKKVAEADLNITQADIDKRQAEVKGLEAARNKLESTLSQLQSDTAYEDQLRKFYSRYWRVSGLMEYLSTWDQVFFLRCNSPVSAMAGFFSAPAGIVRFWTDKPAATCPHCGMKVISFDERPYFALGWPVGAPGRLTLGE